MIKKIAKIFNRSSHEKLSIDLRKLSRRASKERMHILSHTLKELAEEVGRGA